MSSLFEAFLSTTEALEVFSESNFIQAMLRFEASLVQAQAAVGLIPEPAARLITNFCKVELFDIVRIVRESTRAGSIAIPLVKSLRDKVALSDPDAAAFVHFGTTSQDVIDTALVLVTRNALALIEADTRHTAEALLVLAVRHAADPILARTLMQPASVTSFGLKCAIWAAPLVRSLQRLRVCSVNALSLQLGGAVGTLAHMKGKGPQVRSLMAADLALNDPGFAWHAQRDEFLSLACELGLLAGSLGKLARDIALMSQYEISEVAEPLEVGRGASSAMPHKRNAVACMVTLAAAQRVPQRVAAMLAAMPQEHERALGNWQAELAEWPGLLMSAYGAARAMAQALPGLQVYTARMAANLQALCAELPADSAAEWFDPALAAQAATLSGELVRTQCAALAALDAER